MKNLASMLVAFVLMAASLSAQTPTIVRDTLYKVVTGGVAYNIARTDYSDGTYTESKSLLGDTSIVFNTYVTQIESKANQMAAAAIIAMNARQLTNELVKTDTLATALLGRSPITFLMDTYTAPFATGSWSIIYNNVTTSVTFPILSTNKRRRLLPSGGTARTMIVFGNMMRLVNYPISGNNILFKVNDGLWQTIDKTIVLKRA